MNQAGDDEPLSKDLAVSGIGMIPVLGPLLEPLASRAADAVRAEYRRNTSTALRAAERASGMSREDLQERIADDPNLVPLLVKVLFSAGTNGFDDVLKAMGAALGAAVLDPNTVNDAEIVLAAISDLKKHHIHLLTAATQEPPLVQVEGEDPRRVHWMLETLATEAGMSDDMTGLCAAGLVNSGLLRTMSLYGGLGYEVTDLGRLVLEVLAAHRDEK